MRKRTTAWHSKFTLAAAGFTGFVMLLGAPQLRADRCQRRTERAAHHLHEAIDHHGPDSRQAERARHELHDAREYCWSRDHRWWDPDAHRWHTHQNWNDDYHHDHDDNH
ncbi:MAG: hypothetical protein ACRD4R_08290 [Candidatus Acidiferrales bacterium]